jgi:hypothetical protein
MNSDVGKAAAGNEPLVVAVRPGAGVVDRSGDVVLVIPVVEPAQWGRVQHLLELLHRPGSQSGREQMLATVLEQAGDERLPGLALVQHLHPELTVLAYGDVEITVDGPERQRFRGADAGPWASRRVPGPVSLLQVLAAGSPEPPPPGPVLFHLRAGTVPGGGVTLYRAGLGPSGAEARMVEASVAEAGMVAAGIADLDAPAPPPPVSAPQATIARKAITFASVLISGLAEQPHPHRLPLPIEDPADRPETAPDQDGVLVDGVECLAGHFNDPDAGRCATCGATLGRLPGQIVRRPRPALGVLVTDTGSVFALTGGYLIGRAPERDEAVLSGRAKALVLHDVGQSVSRVHAQLDISGWRVLVSDRGSANGTFLSLPGPGAAWERLIAGSPAVFPPGARLRIGARQLLFESYREEVPGRAGRS